MLCKNDSFAIQRFSSRFDKSPGMIAPFASQDARYTWLDKPGRLRDTDAYMSENLSRRTTGLLNTTRDWARQNSGAYAWHKNGKGFLREPGGDQAILIRTTDDLAVLAR